MEKNLSKKNNREWGCWVASGPAFIESGQGRLYFVTDSTGELAGEYVLKELKNPKRIDRFNTELQAIASLKEHTNVVPLVDSGIYRYPDKPCYVMPKADGTLEDHIKRNPLSTEDRLTIFYYICEGVAYLHRNSIIHRDLKPENILMFSGMPKITDLGLCLIADMTRVTPSPEAVGPRFYMAPEFEDGKQVDVGYEADVYSLGKVLYYLLSDGKIYSREKHRNRDWSLPRLLDDARFELFNSVFDRSIVMDKSQRYSDAGELQKSFSEVFDSYRRHPLTTLLKKFDSINNAVQAHEIDLQSLTSGEWSELLTEAKKHKLIISQDLLKAACSSLDPIFAKLFAEALLENDVNFDLEFVAFASRQLLCLPDVDVWFSLWLTPDRFSRLALNALVLENDEIINAIANFSMFTLQQCHDVNSKLAEHFPRLTPEASLNFLVASIKSNYIDKEQLLLSLSYDEKLDKLSLEAVVAGLCAYASPSAIARVIEMADKKEMDEKLAAVGAGIVHGSSSETSSLLSQYDWKSPIIKILIDSMQRNEGGGSDDDFQIESDEE